MHLKPAKLYDLFRSLLLCQLESRVFNVRSPTRSFVWILPGKRRRERPARAAAAVALLINSSLSVVGNKESGKIKICRADRLLRDGKPPTIL